MFNRSAVVTTGYIPSGRLLCEIRPLQIEEIKEVVTEGKAGKKPAMRITGVFQKADEVNQNGRVYPLSVLAEAVEAIQEDIAKRSVVGELDHPADAKIHLDRVSHLITKVWMEGKYVYGEAEVIEGTTSGRNLKALLEAGVQVGISSRGIGDLTTVTEGSEERYIVQPGYRFVTWDVVSEPSVEEATMSVMEGKLNHKLSKVPTREQLRRSNPVLALQAELKRYIWFGK